MSSDLARVELPRLVKKPGAYKRVDTQDELAAALKDGWVLRLDPQSAAVEPEPEPDADLAEVEQAEADAVNDPDADPAAEPGKKKPGRPRVEHAKKK